ncbi:transcriptional regulatory protein (plasmid) [Mycobacterium ulcerans subsp. shinshuense]|uniref:Transcriptional regulatory protein n=2 Tax=Mycobacterium ulcerans TaxID=1809 RepID=A0A1B4YA13_MYCUL|nr:transcriptional regulatory protein [Mycobacterium ulcerans subsp. shinshuense]
MFTMTAANPVKLGVGLCVYDDEDKWFSGYSSNRKAAAICANCPIIVSCTERALRLQVTDGVWATVVMPGSRHTDALEQARARLRRVIEHYRHQPAQQRIRSLLIGKAVHFAATQRQPGPGQRVDRHRVHSPELAERASA